MRCSDVAFAVVLDNGRSTLRILCVVTRGDEIGGAQVHARDLCAELGRIGHELLVVTNGPGPFAAQLEALGVPWISCTSMRRELNPFHDGLALNQLFRIVRRFWPDLICAHTTKAGVLARLVARRHRIPCIVNPHGWSFTDGVPRHSRVMYSLLERSVGPLAERIICVSDYDRRLALRAGISERRLVKIVNGLPDVPPELRALPGESSTLRLAMVARFSSQKDHLTLLRAIQPIEAVTLDLVGDGPLQAATRAECVRLGIESRVRFLGHRDDVADVLARAHLFVLSSNWEGFPLSTIEAMRAGLPVIVSAVGGAPEAVEQGGNGFTVPPGDVTALRVRIEELAVNPLRRAAMGELSRRRYEDLYQFSEMFQRTISLYEEVVDARARRRLGSRQT